MLFETITKNFVKEYKEEKNEDSNKYEGLGEVRYVTDNLYKGVLRGGKLEGSGTYTWRDGVTYKGEFLNNKIIGTGELDWKNGCKYEGQLKNGLRHGFGVFEVSKGKQLFEGNWRKGKAHGRGTCKYRSGGQYTGEWKDGLKDGRGIMIYSSGNVYEGEWKNNVKSGRGKMRWVSKNEVYEGNWVDGKPNGIGIYSWKFNPLRDHQFPSHNMYKGLKAIQTNGLILSGNWVNGMRNGAGIFYYANGGIYEGNWLNNLKHGEGKYVTHTGRLYNGLFDNDHMVEQFNLFDNDKPFTFHLPQTPANHDVVLRELNAIISRHIDDLRKFYHNYCSQFKKMSKVKDRNVISRRILWHFYRISGITLEKTSLADLDRAYAKYFKDDPIFNSRYTDPHNPTAEFIFHDLLEHFLLISDFLYNNQPKLNGDQNNVSDVFASFLKRYVLPNIEFKSIEIKSEDSQYYQIFEELENENKIGMFDMFSKFARKTIKSLPESDKDLTFTIREFSFIMKDFRFFEKYPTLTVQKLIPQIATICPVIENNGSINLDHEMIVYDFRKMFTECAILAFSNQLSQIVKLKSKKETEATVLDNLSAIVAAQVSAPAVSAIHILTNEVGVTGPPLTNIIPPAVTLNNNPTGSIIVSTINNLRRKSATFRPRSGTHSGRKRPVAHEQPKEDLLTVAPIEKQEQEPVIPNPQNFSDNINELILNLRGFYRHLYEQVKQKNPKQTMLEMQRAAKVLKKMQENIKRAVKAKQI